ncbi:hypothetical protein GCM10010358_50600 [Streptomyces minutiscleroticus]|uniref:Uncharacterized protein n=1 Tax=Streptomyces minutiscleroticus TaxID=68238 RepID=A0A918NRI4_9ACTN|nr:hypothetical protein GCM10010358_50600 [Streptomyces minutiscleroticus]
MRPRKGDGDDGDDGDGAGAAIGGTTDMEVSGGSRGPAVRTYDTGRAGAAASARTRVTRWRGGRAGGTGRAGAARLLDGRKAPGRAEGP